MSKHRELFRLLSKENPNIKERQEIVMMIRENGEDLPDVLFENAYLAYKANPKSDQRYINLESAIYGGLELKMNQGMIKKFLIALRNKLGVNPYIQRLGHFINYVISAENSEGYMDDLLKEDKTDSESIKKKLSSYRKFAQFEQYVERLNGYLEVDPSDQQTWIQLGQVYTEKGHYMKAAYCFEELILLNGNNEDYLQKLAELYLTLGGKGNEQKAIQYLSLIVNKRPENMRALWTLYRVTRSSDAYTELNQMCEGCINKIYNKKAPSLKIHTAL